MTAQRIELKGEKILTDVQIQAIESLPFLGESVNQLRVRNWLEQFAVHEWDLAIKLLSHLEYFSISAMSTQFDNGIKDIKEKISGFERSWDEKIKNMSTKTKLDRQLKKRERRLRLFGDNKVKILPVGKFGKSGSSMAYYIAHAPQFKSSKFELIKSPEEISVKNKENFLHLVLFDDFIGSGGSVCQFINEKIQPIIQRKGIVKVKIYLLCVVYMSDAKENVRIKCKMPTIKFFGTERQAAFASSGSPFGYRPSMIVVREFCHKYSKKLYTEDVYKNNVKKTISHPFGYKNTQALVFFEHTTPNNTLPIFWSNRNGWNPLIARNISISFEDNLKFKTQSKIWLSIAIKLGYGELLGSSLYSSKNIKLICYIRLLRKGYARLTICQTLMISEYELKSIIEDGVSRNILQDDQNLTVYGDNLYLNLNRRLSFEKTESGETTKDILYIPKIFRGKT
jgi:hypothetical protein